MKYLGFLVIFAASFSFFSGLLQEEAREKNKALSQQQKLSWPRHWKKLDELPLKHKFLNFYSPNPPEKELAICLKHFKNLGYDAEGQGELDSRTALVWVSWAKATLIVTVKPQKKGGTGSSIDVLIKVKPRKENL
jgi:hypothetical protein